MMIINSRPHPTVEIPPWDATLDDPTATNSPHIFSPQTTHYFTSLQRYLPSSTDADDPDSFDSFECDEFRIYEFKVRKCSRGRSHDWTECPFAHPGEKARRRDPRRYHYSGVACPEFRRGSCRKGDTCEFAHGVFECWLHPARYRTQPCKDGPHCKRRVCFFAHSLSQLRVLPSDSDSPPSKLVGPMRGLQISPRSPWAGFGSGRARFGLFERTAEEEPEMMMERVESGRDLRARIYGRLSQENSLDRDRVDSVSSGPDFGWVSELVK